MSLIYLIFSFIIEVIVTNHIHTISNLSFFLPLFTLVSLVLIAPYLSPKTYFITAFLTGLIYDIVLTDTLLLNAIIFLILAVIINILTKNFHQNIIYNLLLVVGTITAYHLITWIFFIFLSLKFELIYYLYIYIASIVVNIIYTIISYLILIYLKKRKVITSRN